MLGTSTVRRFGNGLYCSRCPGATSIFRLRCPGTRFTPAPLILIGFEEKEGFVGNVNDDRDGVKDSLGDSKGIVVFSFHRSSRDCRSLPLDAAPVGALSVGVHITNTEPVPEVWGKPGNCKGVGGAAGVETSGAVVVLYSDTAW